MQRSAGAIDARAAAVPRSGEKVVVSTPLERWKTGRSGKRAEMLCRIPCDCPVTSHAFE